jgi:hypothetical protein
MADHKLLRSSILRKNPLSLSSINFSKLAPRVRSTGLPQAIASRRAFGQLSLHKGNTIKRGDLFATGFRIHKTCVKTKGAMAKFVPPPRPVRLKGSHVGHAGRVAMSGNRLRHKAAAAGITETWLDVEGR